MKPEICIVVARAKNGVIGGDNQLVWMLPADLKHFKSITFGHPIIMGRTTHTSIGRPLPDRQNIVITTDNDYQAPGCVIAHSTDEALDIANQSNPEKICIIGGGQIYQQMLPITTKIYLTEVDVEPNGDVYFNFDPRDWQQVSSESHQADDKNPYNYRFVELERII